MDISTDLQQTLKKFNILGDLINIEPLGDGNINDTFLATYSQPQTSYQYYVHQKLNRKVFKNPHIVINNMKIVTEHICAKADALLRNNGEEFYALSLVPTNTGAYFATDNNGEIWRTTNFLSGLCTYNVIMSPQHAFEVGKCLGEFHWLVSDINPTLLGDSLPGFHHTEKYFANFKLAVNSEQAQQKINYNPIVNSLVHELLARETYAYTFISQINAGNILLRVVHNDPKINNFMFNPNTNAAVCMIDLDTVKTGIVHYDFGDCIRSSANRLGEESTDFENITIDLNLLSAIAKGYCGVASKFLNHIEKELLVEAPKIISYELCLRFLTSYLLDDGYFKEHYPGNNLNRARVQFALVKDLELKQEEVKKSILAFCK